jgi:HKD family nuclease
VIIESITQPGGGSTLDAVCAAAERAKPSRVDIAVAYITTGGADALIAGLAERLADAAPNVETRWLTSFDYRRTEPLALETIRKLPKTKLRIHDASVLRRKDCTPVKPYHPKTFIFEGAAADIVVAGSGNLSKSGLRHGHEAGIVIGFDKPLTNGSAAAAAAIDQFRAWFESLWDGADEADDALLKGYAASYESKSNLINPTPTEDDLTPEATGPGQISPTDLRKLRACRHLWVAGGNITPNFGDNRPGNQLMLKRLSRVFFGFEALDVPKKTPLGHIFISFGGGAVRECSLTYARNGMDRLTLPIPVTEGPPKYDNENLLFRRLGAGKFELIVGSKAQMGVWNKRSKAIDASFKMASGGRAWGVY